MKDLAVKKIGHRLQPDVRMRRNVKGISGYVGFVKMIEKDKTADAPKLTPRQRPMDRKFARKMRHGRGQDEFDGPLHFFISPL
jgi:hypothetical protein